MSLVIFDTVGHCPSDCSCELLDEASGGSLETCQNACLIDSNCLSLEYQDNNNNECKLCAEICSTDLGGGSHHWCYIKNEIAVTTDEIESTTTLAIGKNISCCDKSHSCTPLSLMGKVKARHLFAFFIFFFTFARRTKKIIFFL